MVNFKTGDRVNIYKEDDETLQNVKGTILKLQNITDDLIFYHIKLDNKRSESHDLGGLCEDGYGIILSDLYLSYDEKQPTLKFTYYDGQTYNVEVVPQEIFYGCTDEYKKEQWLLKAYDIKEKEQKIFAMKNIIIYL